MVSKITTFQSPKGSSSGIGAAIAIQLASYGCKVVLTGRSASALQEVAQKVIKVSPTGSSSAAPPPLTIVSDLLDDGAPKRLISETIAKFGKLNFLVNNAGGTTAKGDLASSNLMQEFDSVMRLNLRSVVELTALAVPYLEATSGAIVNISSVAGKLMFARKNAFHNRIHNFLFAFLQESCRLVLCTAPQRPLWTWRPKQGKVFL